MHLVTWVVTLTSLFLDELEIQEHNSFLEAVVRKDPETQPL